MKKNEPLYDALFSLLSLADDSDIRAIVCSASGYMLGRGKISIDEFEEIMKLTIKKD